MKEFKNFVAYVPSATSEEAENLPYEILYMRDEEGKDWYEIQTELSQDSIKVVYDDNGTVAQYNTDASVLYPLGFSVAVINAKDFTTDGDKPLNYSGGKVSVDYIKVAESRRQSLLASASETIADWKMELQLGSISDDDKAILIRWVAYIKVLKALDFADVKDNTGYKSIIWPDEP
jgi:hypothetical protein